MRKVSKKRASELREYYKLKKEFLKQNPMCAVCGDIADQIHHKAGRQNHMLLETKYWLAVDFKCHKIIEENPGWAKEKGYTINRTTI